MNELTQTNKAFSEDIYGVGAHLRLIGMASRTSNDSTKLLSNLENAAGELQEIIDAVRGSLN